MSETNDIAELLRRAATGDESALTQILDPQRERLKRLVRLRLNRLLQGQIDESDVVQEVLLEASRRLPDYAVDPAQPFYVWLRFIAGRKLIDLQRRHLGAEMRDAALEVSLNSGGLPPASSASLAAQLLGRMTSPSQAAMKAELQLRMQQALNELDPVDREILALRHFEQLSNSETAAILGVGKSAASSRYLRALKKIKDLLVQDGDMTAN